VLRHLLSKERRRPDKCLRAESLVERFITIEAEINRLIGNCQVLDCDSRAVAGARRVSAP